MTRQRELTRNWMAFESSKPSDTLPSIKAHLLILPKQLSLWGPSIQISEPMEAGTLSFKPPHKPITEPWVQWKVLASKAKVSNVKGRLLISTSGFCRYTQGCTLLTCAHTHTHLIFTQYHRNLSSYYFNNFRFFKFVERKESAAILAKKFSFRLPHTHFWEVS